MPGASLQPIPQLAEEFCRALTSKQSRHLMIFSPSSSKIPIIIRLPISVPSACSNLSSLANKAGAAEVGFAVGYESASQFSCEYKRLFGAPPGRHTQTARAALGDVDPQRSLGDGDR